jgi:low affinity Fe/Cu permease
MKALRAAFARFARIAAHLAGQPGTFILAVAIILAWAATGKFFDWSDTWQLIINTGTTIITFLMVFLIQNTQNTDTKAMHMKLDEVIRSLDKARDDLIGLEKLPEDQLDRME